MPFGKGQYFGSLVNGNPCLMKQSVAVLIFLLWHLIILSLADPQMAFFNPENIWLNTPYFWSIFCSHFLWEPLLPLLFTMEAFRIKYLHFLLSFLESPTSPHSNLSFIIYLLLPLYVLCCS